MYSSLGSYGGGFGMGGLSGMYGMGSMGSGYGSLRPGADQQPNNQQQQRNLRTEYYGMLGGLNSMLQLGFAGISLTVFLQNVAAIIKTSYNWFRTIIVKFGKFIWKLPIIRLIPLLFSKLRLEAIIKPNNKSTSNKLIYLLRLLAIVGILIMLYIKKQMKSQVQKQCQQLAKEVDVSQNNQQEQVQFIANKPQKQGFF